MKTISRSKPPLILSEAKSYGCNINSAYTLFISQVFLSKALCTQQSPNNYYKFNRSLAIQNFVMEMHFLFILQHLQMASDRAFRPGSGNACRHIYQADIGEPVLLQKKQYHRLCAQATYYDLQLHFKVQRPLADVDFFCLYHNVCLLIKCVKFLKGHVIFNNKYYLIGSVFYILDIDFDCLFNVYQQTSPEFHFLFLSNLL